MQPNLFIRGTALKAVTEFSCLSSELLTDSLEVKSNQELKDNMKENRSITSSYLWGDPLTGCAFNAA